MATVESEDYGLSHEDLYSEEAIALILYNEKDRSKFLSTYHFLSPKSVSILTFP